jgi:hypothetical protein
MTNSHHCFKVAPLVRLAVVLALSWSANIPDSMASSEHAGHKAAHSTAAQADLAVAAPLRAILNFAAPLQANQPATGHFTLSTAGGDPVTFAGLRTVHTRKIHMLVVDATLTDYQHLHPVPGKTPGTYNFEFTPKTANPYIAWLDVTPRTGAQQYIRLTVHHNTDGSAKITPTLNDTATVAGLTFHLTFDTPQLYAGTASLATLSVTDSTGKPFADLQPVLGAYAHVVGFAADLKSVAHVHPMGDAPKTDSSRGGPQLQFHFEPQTPGYLKIFAQFRIHDADVFIPFGLQIEP